MACTPRASATISRSTTHNAAFTCGSLKGRINTIWLSRSRTRALYALLPCITSRSQALRTRIIIYLLTCQQPHTCYFHAALLLAFSRLWHLFHCTMMLIRAAEFSGDARHFIGYFHTYYLLAPACSMHARSFLAVLSAATPQCHRAASSLRPVNVSHHNLFKPISFEFRLLAIDSYLIRYWYRCIGFSHTALTTQCSGALTPIMTRCLLDDVTFYL